MTLCLTSLTPAEVRTDSGIVKGVRNGDLTVFKGIPYAAPPLGKLRWRGPRPVTPWKGVFHANKFAPACMQIGVSMPGEKPPAVSEDCLYVNVWTRARHPRKRQPVLVWIYGGGFTNGSASMPLYWGDNLTRKGIVVVTFGYRLGPFGFLCYPELARESRSHSTGNYGFLDQIAALQWVRRNIASFGGDPSCVTIAGQSAGATSVSVLMASPLAKGLFQRAIAESGGLFESLQLAPTYELKNAEREGVAYASSLGVHSIAALRKLPARKLLGGLASEVSHPVIEPHVLPNSPYAEFVEGRESHVPILVGSNADEARAMNPHIDDVKAATFVHDIAMAWGPLPIQLLAPYPHKTDQEAQRARLDFERDLRFGWDIWSWARLDAEGGSAAKPSRDYYYYFTHKPPFPDGSVKAHWGASHFAELWYVFDHLGQEPWRWTASDRRLENEISSYWVNFAKYGDPNGPGLPHWPRFTNQDPQVLYLDDPIRVGGVANLSSLKVFDAVYSRVRGAQFGALPSPFDSKPMIGPDSSRAGHRSIKGGTPQ